MAERSIPRQLLTAAVAESGVFTVNDAVAVGTDETFLGIVLADKQRNAGCDAFFHQLDFCRGKLSADLPATSYKIGAYSALLSDVLPDGVYQRLRRAFPLFDKKMRGYYTSQSLLLATESRTSSPVRIPRDSETLQHISLRNLYPCGEGAGYSGGIVSSALDGINVARKV